MITLMIFLTILLFGGSVVSDILGSANRHMSSFHADDTYRAEREMNEYWKDDYWENDYFDDNL